MERSGHGREGIKAAFEERVGGLFEEIAFALENERPSILLAPYTSEYVRLSAEEKIKEKLRELDQQLLPLTVNEENFDLPLLLAKHPQRHAAVFSIHGLSRGGGREGANAYRALNMRRELLVDYAVRAVFWANPAESVQLARHAPDFWAFRHRVVEFDPPDFLKLIPLPVQGNLERQPSPAEPLEQRRTIRRMRKEVRLHPQEAFGWLDLGLTYLSQGRGEPARRALRKCLQLAPENPLAWGGLGQVQRLLGRPILALEACRKAAELAPRSVDAQLRLADLCLDLGLWEEARSTCHVVLELAPADAQGWFLLGRLEQMDRRYPDAIINYRQSIKLDPQSLPARFSLANCYKMMGAEDSADECLSGLGQQVENSPAYEQAVYAAVCGEAGKAVDWLEKALEQQQVTPARLLHHPDLELLREDARFQQLLVKGKPAS